MNSMQSFPYHAGYLQIPARNQNGLPRKSNYNMCRRITRQHVQCEHFHTFWVIECDKFAAKKMKWVQRKGFWSKLLHSEPSCKIFEISESRYYFCPFCTRARREVYPSDHYGVDFEANGEAHSTPDDKSWEGLLRGGPSRQDSSMPDMPPDLRSSFLELPSSQRQEQSEVQLPTIRSNIVNPGIDFERWSHVRDHIIPPSPGPPPNKPLPHIPSGRQKNGEQKQQASASQTQQPGITSSRIQHKPVAGHRGERHPNHDIQREDSQASPFAPLSRPHSRRQKISLPLILDKDREVPEMAFLPEPNLGRPLTLSFLQNDESSGQEMQTPVPRVRRGGSGTNRSREKPNKFHPSSVSPLSPIMPNLRNVDGPKRRAHTVSGRYENVRSAYGEIAYISPKLEERIDSVEDYWLAAGAPPLEGHFDMRRAETNPIQQKGKGNSKPRRKINFNDKMRGDSHQEQSPQ